MFNLVIADLFKQRKSMTVKILFCVTGFSAIILAFLSYLLTQGDIAADMVSIGFLLCDIQMMTLLGSIMAALMICGDFENKAIQDSVSCGISRIDIITGKTITYFISIAIVLLPYIIVTVVSFCLGNESGEVFNASMFHVVLMNLAEHNVTLPVFAKLLAVMAIITVIFAARLSICVLFSFLFKKPVLVIGIGYFTTLLLDNANGLWDNVPVLKEIFNFTPYSAEFINLSVNSGAGELIKPVLVGIIFIIFIIAVTYGIFRRSEIK